MRVIVLEILCRDNADFDIGVCPTKSLQDRTLDVPVVLKVVKTPSQV